MAFFLLCFSSLYLYHYREHMLEIVNPQMSLLILGFFPKGDYLQTKYDYYYPGRCSVYEVGDCIHLSDGVYEHPRRNNNTLFIRCYRNRLVEEGMCPIDHVWGTQTYPYNKACTQKFAIPTSYYMNVGLLPSCSGKSDGNYQFRTRPCDAYYRCEGGKAIAVKCPQHTYFDVIRRRCSSDVACYRAWWSTVDFLRELYFNSLYYFL